MADTATMDSVLWSDPFATMQCFVPEEWTADSVVAKKMRTLTGYREWPEDRLLLYEDICSLYFHNWHQSPRPTITISQDMVSLNDRIVWDMTGNMRTFIPVEDSMERQQVLEIIKPIRTYYDISKVSLYWMGMISLPAPMNGLILYSSYSGIATAQNIFLVVCSQNRVYSIMNLSEVSSDGSFGSSTIQGYRVRPNVFILQRECGFDTLMDEEGKQEMLKRGGNVYNNAFYSVMQIGSDGMIKGLTLPEQIY